MSQYKSEMYDVIIVGSGAAGVSSAWPLVKSGKTVLMLDVGYIESDNENNSSNNLNSSPKVRAPEFSYVFKNFNEFYNIETDKFVINGSLAKGGLSNAWSALVSSFDNDEFAEYPFERKDIIKSYNSVAKRIGISGENSGDLLDWLGNDYFKLANLPIHPLVNKLLKNYEIKKLKFKDFDIKMGRHNQAILSTNYNDRSAYSQSSMNGYKDSSGAQYNAADEVSALKKFENFKYINNLFVEEVIDENSKCTTIAKNIKKNSYDKFYSKIIILAAGTIGSTKLALKLNKHFNEPITLKNTPMYPFALLFPREFGRKKTYKSFSYWHMSYYLQLENLSKRHKIYGHITTTDGINNSELSDRIPLPYPLNNLLSNFLWPKMLLGTCIFPGYFSQNKIELKKNNILNIKGNTSNEYLKYVKITKKTLSKIFRKLGAIMLSSSTLPTLGVDSHYASSMPMKENPNKMETNMNGLIGGKGNIYCVDGAVLSELPAKSHTFTIMANADRISKSILQV